MGRMNRRWMQGALLAILMIHHPRSSSGVPMTTFRVNAVSPAPGSILTAVPAELVVTLSGAIDISSVHDASVILVGAGPDATFDTADDVPIVPAGISVASGTEIHLDLTGIPLANDTYRITLRGNTPINAGRVAWWRLDEASGGVVKDSSG